MMIGNRVRDPDTLLVHLSSVCAPQSEMLVKRSPALRQDEHEAILPLDPDIER